MVDIVKKNGLKEEAGLQPKTSLYLWILFYTLALIAFFVLIVLACKEVKAGDLDDHIRSSLYGVWKELHHQDCLDGESIVIYYPHMKFEEFTTYIANEDCEFIETGDVVRAGAVTHKTVSGDWDVVDGYIHYVTDLGKEVTSLKVNSMGTKQASFSWGNGNTLQGYKIGGID